MISRLLMLLPYLDASNEVLKVAKGKHYLATGWKDMVGINKQLHGRNSAD